MEKKATQKPKSFQMHQIEFFRQGMALMPEPPDKRPGVAFFVPGNDFQLTQRFCTCTLSKSRTCSHQKQLAKAFKAMNHQAGQPSFEDRFRASIWYHLAAILGEASGETPEAVRFRTQKSGDNHIIKVTDSNGQTLLHYLSQETDRVRFVERCTSTIPDDGVPNRAWALSRLNDITRTDNEKNMNAQGFRTRKQFLEASFWFKCAYHCHREFEADNLQENNCTFEPAISKKPGVSRFHACHLRVCP